MSMSMTNVLLFTQETCEACVTQREKNDGLEAEFPEVDIQTDLETAEEYGVRKTPTTLVYANGRAAARQHRTRMTKTTLLR